MMEAACCEQPTPRKSTSGIQGSTEVLSDVISDLDNTFSMLRERLDPVLLPVGADECGSALRTDVDISTGRLRSLREAISELLQRIDL